MYYVYILRCKDDTLYTGLACHLCRRMKEHQSRNARCARYTRSHHAEALAGLWAMADRKTAARLEYAVKQLPRAEKDHLLREPERAGMLVPDSAVAPVGGVTLAACLSDAFDEEKAARLLLSAAPFSAKTAASAPSKIQ